ncbi:MAG: replication-relaxation family protein [Planctomycetaceae bacterium]
MSKSSFQDSTSRRQQLSVWELPKLLRSVHQHRKSKPKKCRERPHFRAILAFVHRNRFAVASQIQRRFSKFLKSDRTARRHLAEMESLGYVSVVDANNTSPLWPKVYFVTGRGVARLRKALHDQGQEWSEATHDRRRSDCYSAQHVLHELFISEFLLQTWESAEASDDLEILTIQRRSLAKHDAFKVIVAGRRTRLQPDGMFLYRQQGRGMMACFVEIDLDTMSPRQIAAKFRRYQGWVESSAGSKYLKSLYERHGASNPTAVFRILMIIGSKDQKAENRRLARIVKLASEFPALIRHRLWFTTVSQCWNNSASNDAMAESNWLRLNNASLFCQSR